MSNYSSYLGSKKCCNTTGPQGPQGPVGWLFKTHPAINYIFLQ